MAPNWTKTARAASKAASAALRCAVAVGPLSRSPSIPSAAPRLSVVFAHRIGTRSRGNSLSATSKTASPAVRWAVAAVPLSQSASFESTAPRLVCVVAQFERLPIGRLFLKGCVIRRDRFRPMGRRSRSVLPLTQRRERAAEVVLRRRPCLIVGQFRERRAIGIHGFNQGIVIASLIANRPQNDTQRLLKSTMLHLSKTCRCIQQVPQTYSNRFEDFYKIFPTL